MKANGAILTVDKNGPVPDIELIVGDAQFGDYVVYLWDATGQKSTVVQEGRNDDKKKSAKFRVGNSVGELDGCPVSWEVTIAALGGSQGQLYSLQVVFTQGVNVLQRFEVTGALDAVKEIDDIAKFSVA
jgi:hypothetical protein